MVGRPAAFGAGLSLRAGDSAWEGTPGSVADRFSALDRLGVRSVGIFEFTHGGLPLQLTLAMTAAWSSALHAFVAESDGGADAVSEEDDDEEEGRQTISRITNVSTAGTVGTPHRCDYNDSNPHRDGRCAVFMGLEPIAVLDPADDRMLCFWPDPAQPDPAKWQSQQTDRAHPVNIEAGHNVTD